MTYSPEVKENACKMYREGTPPLSIAKKLKIPQSTIYGWVRSHLPQRRPPIICSLCGKAAEKSRPNRRYCSPKCRKRAKYRRARKREGKMLLLLVQCPVCKQSFDRRNDTRHEYCSKRCKDKASKRRDRERTRVIETLENAIRDASDGTIKKDDYETEIDTITDLLKKDLLGHKKKERVQKILHSIRVDRKQG